MSIGLWFVMGLYGIVAQAQFHRGTYFEEDEGLVDVTIVASDELDYDVEFDVDLIYFHESIFGSPLYTHNKLFLRKHTAHKFLAAARECNDLGYKLIAVDGYRPLSIQKRMIEIMAIERLLVLCPDMHGMYHTRGAAVDVCFVDKETGCEAASVLLKSIMIKHGFESSCEDDRHFNDTNIEKYRELNISFEHLVNREHRYRRMHIMGNLLFE